MKAEVVARLASRRIQDAPRISPREDRTGGAELGVPHPLLDHVERRVLNADDSEGVAQPMGRGVGAGYVSVFEHPHHIPVAG